MRTNLNPIMLGLLAALAGPAMAVEHGTIDLSPPTSNDVNLVLNSGDTITHSAAGPAVVVAGTNKVSGDGVTIAVSGAAEGAVVAAVDGVISLTNSAISLTNAAGSASGNAIGVYAVFGGRVELQGGSVTTDDLSVVVEGAGSTFIAKDVAITTSQKVGATAATPNTGLIASGTGAIAAIEGGKLVAIGDHVIAASVVSDATLLLRNTEVISDGAAAAVLVDSGGKFEMSGGSIKAAKDGARGISVGSSQGANSLAILRNVNMAMGGDYAVALSAGGMSQVGGELSVIDSDVKTSGANSHGVLAGNQSRVTLDNTRVSTEGANAYGIASFSHIAGGQAVTETVIRNGSQISTRNAAALVTVSGPQTFLVSDSIITGRTAGAIDGGVLLHATAFNAILSSERVLLDASRSMLTGDVLADHGTVSASLRDGSVLTGALVEGARGRIAELDVDRTSTWRVRGDSSLEVLKNDGLVAFVAPAAGTSFKTVTVKSYVGGGTLVLNTRLSGDASASDKLVIDGGTASGNTSLRVINAGGADGQGQEGIRVVQTINGGTTSVDAFRLDAGSTGYRASSNTLSLNGYEYSLMRGGKGDEAHDWYLAFGNTPASQTTEDGAGKPGYKNVSPESGAYAGNQLASTRMFTHSLYDRVASYKGDDAGSRARGAWTRVLGRRDSGLGMSEGRVDVATDSSVLQLGVDLLKADVGATGALYAGLMGGYGDARVRSTSTLMRPAGATVQARTDGKVSGYSVGLYGTYYQNDETRLGAYADSWLQWGRYSNQLNSELGAARYHSTVVSASLEAGYALTPFASDSTFGSIVVQPHVQMTYSRYDASDVTMQQGTRMRSGSNDALDSRVGVRVYPQAAAGAPVVRPFLEANWLHAFSNPSVKMGGNVIDSKVSRNTMELKLGAEGYVGRAVKMSGHVFGQAGNNSQRGYGGMLNMAYRW